MPRSLGPVSIPALALCLGLLASPARGQGGGHLLFSEFAVTPTDGEFVEIFNPTADSIDVSNYYICDYALRFVDSQTGLDEPDNNNNYWHLPDGALLPDLAFPNDFLARFPAGTVLLPGETVVISMKDDALFSGYWSTSLNPVRPDFELAQDGPGDGVLDMVDPGPEILSDPNNNRYILSAAGLSNAREVVVLFYWDGQSDLVQDVDIVQWGNAGPVFATLSPNKTAIAIDGPDPDNSASTYRDDTPRVRQELAHNGQHSFGFTVSRRDFAEGNEVTTGGNGLTGHDETSENYTQTWLANTDHSIGNPGPFGPPEVSTVSATGEGRILVVMSRAVDRGRAEDVSNYDIRQIEDEAGAPVDEVPLAVTRATLDDDSGTEVTLETGRQAPVALYRLLASNITAAGAADELIAKPVLFRGFNVRPQIELDVPRHPFVPQGASLFEITYTAPQGETVLVRMFDLQGRELFVLAEETVPAGGRQTIRWDGRDHLRQRLPAGVYMIHARMESSGGEVVAPVVVAATSGALR